MRYFTKSDNQTVDIDRIAGEIINISFGRNYFINGRPNPQPDMKTNYNTYIIDSVEYEIHPNVGTVILLCSDTVRDQVYATIKQRVSDFERLLHATHGFKKVSTGTSGTTQYLLLEDAGFSGITNIGFLPINSTHERIPDNTGITWLITNDVYYLVFPSYSTKYDREKIIFSLSAIIYDAKSALRLTDGYFSPDYPDIYDTTSYHMNRIIKDRVHVSANNGLYIEIARLFGVVKPPRKVDSTVRIYRQKPENFVPFPDGRVLNWIKWEDVKPLGNEVSVLGTLDLVKRGLLNFDESLKDESEELQKSKSKPTTETYKCFITGIPIYEDTYVFDVYQQILEEVIDVNDFDKYPGAEIIPMEVIVVPDVEVKTNPSESKTTNANDEESEAEEDGETEENDQYVSSYVRRRRERERKRKEAEKKKKEVAKKKNAAALKKKKEAEKKMAESLKLANELVKQRREEKASGKTSTVSDDTLKDALVDGTTKKKMPLKRGQKKAVELIKIRRTVNYDTSRHLLVSPFYVHCMGINDVVSKFERDTGTKVLVFRTFSPRTLTNVINSIEDLQPPHRQFLHEFNCGATYTGTVLKTVYVNITDEPETNNILEASTNARIFGTWSLD